MTRHVPPFRPTGWGTSVRNQTHQKKQAEVRTVTSMQAEYRNLRNAAHAGERAEFERLARDPNFRHFIALCISERAASDVGPVEIRSSDPEVVTLAAHWLRRLSHGRVDYRLQFSGSTWRRRDPGAGEHRPARVANGLVDLTSGHLGAFICRHRPSLSSTR
jgi:hypothetical protein